MLDWGQISSPSPQALQESTHHVQIAVKDCRWYTTHWLVVVVSMAEAI